MRLISKFKLGKHLSCIHSVYLKQRCLWTIYSLFAYIALMAGVFYGETAAAEGFYPYITNTIPIHGYVKKLIIPSKTPNFLFALAQNDGRPKPSDKTGLYVFDISDAERPRQINYLSITSPIGMDLSPNGTLFLYSAFYEGHDLKAWYGVRMLDISDPKAIKEVNGIELDIHYVGLSIDGKLLFVRERGLVRKNDENYFFSIYRVPSANNPNLLTRVKKRGPHGPGYGFYPTPDGKHLLIEGYNDNFFVYDISEPSGPKEKVEIYPNLGHPKTIGSDGMMYLLNGDDLVIANTIPKATKFGSLRGRFSNSEILHIGEDNKTLYLSTLDKSIYVVDLFDRNAPKLVSQYITPNYIGSLMPSRRNNVIYAGLLDSIAVIDPAKSVVTSEMLIKAHTEALRQYKRKDLKFDFERIGNAMNILEAAGIRNAIELKPSGLSDKAFAAILNDYGFFLAKRYRDEEAVEVYRKVIKLDPFRSVAYLNLGDSLRKRLSATGSFQEKTALTKEIKAAYTKYKKQSGRSTPEVDSFLSLNIVDNPIADFCAYVAAYTNTGRLREIFGSGRSVTKSDGGSMRIEISYEGTGHFPYVRFIDNKTNEELNEQIPDNGRDISWSANIDIIPFSDGHHLLYHNYDRYLVASTPIGAAQQTGNGCRFDVHVSGSFDKKGAEAEICRLVQSSERPDYIPLEESESLDEKTIEAAGYYWTNEFRAGKIDFDNDSKADSLVHLKYQSGAGPGCTYDFFDLFNEQGDGFSKSRSRSLLLEMQGVEKRANSLHPVPFCRGNVTGWFRNKGVTYYETKYPEEQPRNSQQEFHTVSYIKDGKIKRACEAKFKVQVEVQR